MQNGRDIRDHLRKALQGLFDIGASRHIVLYSLDEWRIRDASGVGCGIFAVGMERSALIEGYVVFQQSALIPKLYL